MQNVGSINIFHQLSWLRCLSEGRLHFGSVNSKIDYVCLVSAISIYRFDYTQYAVNSINLLSELNLNMYRVE